jgi:hypothetical protein
MDRGVLDPPLALPEPLVPPELVPVGVGVQKRLGVVVGVALPGVSGAEVSLQEMGSITVVMARNAKDMSIIRNILISLNDGRLIPRIPRLFPSYFRHVP